MNERKREFIAFLVETRALQFGDFTLKSGEKSPFFVDLGSVRSGKQLDYLGRALAGGLREHYRGATLLFGPAYKGIALATAASVGCFTSGGEDIALFYNRKEAKGHGEKGMFIGQHPTPKDKVVIIDDVLSSGGTKLESAKAIEEAFGVKPMGVLVTLDRTRKDSDYDRAALPVHALVDLNDLADYLQATGDERSKVVREFWEGKP